MAERILSEDEIEAVESFKFDIQYAVVRQMKERGVSRLELAKRLNVQPARVTAILGDTANLTLETIARIFHALESRPVIYAEPNPSSQEGSNV